MPNLFSYSFENFPHFLISPVNNFRSWNLDRSFFAPLSIVIIRFSRLLRLSFIKHSFFVLSIFITFLDLDCWNFHSSSCCSGNAAKPPYTTSRLLQKSFVLLLYFCIRAENFQLSYHSKIFSASLCCYFVLRSSRRALLNDNATANSNNFRRNTLRGVFSGIRAFKSLINRGWSVASSSSQFQQILQFFDSKTMEMNLYRAYRS